MEGLWKEMRGDRKGNKSIGNDRGEVTVIEVNRGTDKEGVIRKCRRGNNQRKEFSYSSALNRIIIYTPCLVFRTGI